MEQTQHDGVADSDVGDHQQGPIDPRPRAPRCERVDAEGGRASDEDLETAAGASVGWGHAACVRKNETSKMRPDLADYCRDG